MPGTLSDDYLNNIVKPAFPDLNIRTKNPELSPGYFSHSEPWYLNRYGVGAGEKENMISSLLRNLATLNMQQQNRVSDATAFLPEGVGLAGQRAADYNSAVAGQQGIVGINQYANQANRQAWRDIGNLFLSKRSIDANQPSAGEQILGTLGQIGQGVGYAYGASLF